MALLGASVAAAAPSPADEADLRRVEGYFNKLKTVEANVVQTNPDGTTARGRLYISRPGKLRFEYAPPVPILIVANGPMLIHYDKQLQQATNVAQEATPAWFLTAPEVKLIGGDLTVDRVDRGAQALAVTLHKTQEPEAGTVTLFFGTQAFALQGWEVRDAQGNQTRVTLVDYKADQPIDPKLFDFKEKTWEQLERGRR